MLHSDMNLNIKTRTARYNNKILVSDGKFNLGKNDEVNAGSTKISHNVVTATHNIVTTTHAQIAHEEEKVALILSLAGTFTRWYMFR